jgi:Leucyl aminopeptidase (aminopeptidase T)
MDSRYVEKMAKVLLDYSLEVKKDEILIINSSYLSEPLLLELYKEALLRGAHPVLKISLPDSSYYFYRYAQEHQLRFIPPWSKIEMETANCILNIMATKNSKALANIDPEKMRISNLASKELVEIFEERYIEVSSAGALPFIQQRRRPKMQRCLFRNLKILWLRHAT